MYRLSFCVPDNKSIPFLKTTLFKDSINEKLFLLFNAVTAAPGRIL